MTSELLIHDATVLTMDADAVQERATDAVERFADESGWEIGIGGADPPGVRELLSDLPKRGPARLLSRLAIQSIKDR